MISDFNAHGQLPPGIHVASWDEFLERYAITPHRQQLAAGLKLLMDHLRSVGCKAVYVDRSFVSSKERPNDYDACWDVIGVKIEKVNPILLSFSDEGKEAMQQKYRGDARPDSFSPVESEATYLQFFQIDRKGQSQRYREAIAGQSDMIKNPRQLTVTRQQLELLTGALAKLADAPQDAATLVRRSALEADMAKLRQEITDYEAARSKKIDFSLISSVTNLGKLLVQARIAAKLTQEDLARELGRKPQQVQRYESEQYTSVSLGTLARVASILAEKVQVARAGK